MTESEWLRCRDAGFMLEQLWSRYGISSCEVDPRFCGNMQNTVSLFPIPIELDLALHRYYLTSCRGIWELLPQEASRRGVELAEQFFDGAVSANDLSEYNWHVEGAAFCIDYNCDPEAIDRWVAEVLAIPKSRLQSMLHGTEAAQIEPRELLMRAAYFADYAMIYPSITPKGPPSDTFSLFLSPEVLRNFVGYPFTRPLNDELG